MKRTKEAIAAAALFILAACAAAPVGRNDTALPGPIECAARTQPDNPGGHGGYGGFYQDEPPYYPERPADRPLRQGWGDPYFTPGEDPTQLRAYRGCLLRTPRPEKG